VAPLPRTLAGVVSHTTEVRRSRFLARLAPVRSFPEADDVVSAARREHWDARHHCVATVLGHHADTQRSTDDGEPSGTAGVPMLEVLHHRELTDVVVVVSRYFGGVLLGTGGLIRAYSGAVSAAVDEAEARGLLLARRRLVEVEVPVPHADSGRIDHLLRGWAARHDAQLGATTYSDVARIVLLVPPGDVGALRADVAAASSGSVEVVTGPERLVDVPVPPA
jgi:uncharacterized YigZ family protein